MAAPLTSGCKVHLSTGATIELSLTVNEMRNFIIDSRSGKPVNETQWLTFGDPNDPEVSFRADHVVMIKAIR